MGALRRIFAPITLAVFLCSLALPLLPSAHLTWDDDEDGGPGIAAQHHAVTEIAAVQAPIALEHCALCHLQRALAGATVVQIVSPTPRFISRELCAATFVVWHAQPASIDQPSRAPPASSLL